MTSDQLLYWHRYYFVVDFGENADSACAPDEAEEGRPGTCPASRRLPVRLPSTLLGCGANLARLPN